MIKYKYLKTYDGDWFYTRRRRWLMKCCDCGLTHIVNFKLTGKINKRIMMQVFRK